MIYFQDFNEDEWKNIRCESVGEEDRTRLVVVFVFHLSEGKVLVCSAGERERERMVAERVPSYWECFSKFCQQTILHGWHYLTVAQSQPACCCCHYKPSLLDYSLTNLSEQDTSATPGTSSSQQQQQHCSITRTHCQARQSQSSRFSSDSNVYRSVFWSIIVFASVVSGGFFLHDNTSEFLKSTVQTTLDSMVPLSQVLFPSVVVCNINQIRKSLFNELGFYDNETLVRIMYEDFIKGTKDNSENATYLGSDYPDEEDDEHSLKRKEFYQVKTKKLNYRKY